MDLPASQNLHMTWPFWFWYLPTSHVMQLVALSALWYLPASQSVHDRALSPLNLPASQILQEPEFAEE
jgi:hypothetical protein